MRGPWVEDSLTTNTPGKHGLFQIDFYRVMIHPFGENQKFLYVTYTKNEDPLVPWRDPKSNLKTANLDLLRTSPWNAGHIPSSHKLPSGPVGHWRGCWVPQRLSGSRTSWDPGEVTKSNLTRSTNGALPHLQQNGTCLITKLREKSATWIGLSNRSMKIMDAASSLVKIWGPIAITSPFH